MLTYLGSVYGIEPTRINVAIYEDLKSRGFELIKDDILRLNISQYFEKAKYHVDGYAFTELSFNQGIKPYCLKYFQDTYSDYSGVTFFPITVTPIPSCTSNSTGLF